MEFRTLGKTGLRVSAFGVGTWQLCGPTDLDGAPNGHPDPGAAAAVDLIRRCGDLGINLIDTAPMYGLGEAERRVGQAIAGQRDRWIIATKFGVQRAADGSQRIDLSPAAVRAELEASLRRLQTDYVDLFSYHCAPDPTTTAAVHAELEALRREGKLRHHGISTKDPAALRRLLDGGGTDVVMVAQSMATHPRQALKLAENHGLGVLTRGVLEWGRLSGRYFEAPDSLPFAADDIRSHAFRGQDLAAFAAFGALVPPGATMPQFAMRSVLDAPTTHSIVLGGKRIEHYESALGALDLPPLTVSTRRAIEACRAALRPSRPRRILRRAGRAARSLLRI